MKIVVYAICKDEAQFVERWTASMSEADEIVVLDTGSADGTPDLLRARGVTVYREVISPWRFDAARNRSLDLVPEDADICVCTDLDEVFRPGWRALLEAAWTPGCSQATYRYTWSFRPDGSEGHVFWYEKIHCRHGFRWNHPVHEVLQWVGPGAPGPKIRVEGMQLDHHPDPEKSRAQYLPLLELSVREAPEDDRNMHYLGREYLFRQDWDHCIATLERHLAMPSARWADERCASMRFLARAWRAKGRDDLALGWLLRAAAEAPHLREPFVELARLLYDTGDWPGTVWAARRALSIARRPETYICEAFAWGSLPHDLLAMGCYHLGLLPQALEAARQALEQEPGSERLRDNVAILEHLAKEQGGAQA